MGNVTKVLKGYGTSDVSPATNASCAPQVYWCPSWPLRWRLGGPRGSARGTETGALGRTCVILECSSYGDGQEQGILSTTGSTPIFQDIVRTGGLSAAIPRGEGWLPRSNHTLTVSGRRWTPRCASVTSLRRCAHVFGAQRLGIFHGRGCPCGRHPVPLRAVRVGLSSAVRWIPGILGSHAWGESAEWVDCGCD